MAISAATTSKDRVFRSDDSKSLFESILNLVDSTISINQGDICFLDTTAHQIKKVAALADAATVIGISPVKIVNGVLSGPYDGLATAAAAAVSEARGPQYGVVANMKLKAADAFHPGDKVYLADALDTQTVTITDTAAAGNYVGVYVGPSIASAASGQEGQIKIGLRGVAGTGAALQF